LDDDQLMLAYAAGDLQAFDVLFERWAPRLHAFFSRTLGSSADADDLLQLTFLRMHRARSSFHPGQPLRAWMFAIAARLQKDELRRRSRSTRAATEARSGADEKTAMPDDHDAHSELASVLRAALEELPESQRTVIHLHRYERMSFAEIAEVLGTTQGAVKLRAFRAYRRLRSSLAALLENEDAA
jgi:RNA polymerase sigma-70 factor (ECF subfamily)